MKDNNKPKQKPDTTIKLAVCGRALALMQQRQYDSHAVRFYGQVKLGQYLLTPGKDREVVFDDLIRQAVADGIIVVVHAGVIPK